MAPVPAATGHGTGEAGGAIGRERESGRWSEKEEVKPPFPADAAATAEKKKKKKPAGSPKKSYCNKKVSEKRVAG